MNALEQLAEQPKSNANVIGLDDESSQLSDNSVSEQELVMSDVSFGADDRQLSVIDEMPDKEDRVSSRLNVLKQAQTNEAKQYIEGKVKRMDIDYTPGLSQPSTAAPSKLLQPQKPIVSETKQQLNAIDDLLRELESDYQLDSVDNEQVLDQDMRSTMKRQP